MMITIWGRANSINVQKVMWLTAELGLEHERIDAGGPFGGLDDPAFLDLNPNGMIPVVKDGDTVIWDSHAIIRYLAAQYGAGTWWLDTPAQRSEGDRWMEWLSAQVWPDMRPVFFGLIRTPAEERDYDAINSHIATVNGFVSHLESHLTNRAYVAGDQISLGDVPIGTFIYRYLNMDFDKPAMPHLAAYYKRLKEREAYKTHVMLPIT